MLASLSPNGLANEKMQKNKIQKLRTCIHDSRGDNKQLRDEYIENFLQELDGGEIDDKVNTRDDLITELKKLKELPTNKKLWSQNHSLGMPLLDAEEGMSQSGEDIGSEGSALY